MFIKVLIRTVNWFSILTYFKGTTWLAVASVVFAHLLKATMREKCPNTEFFLVHKVTIKNAIFFATFRCIRTEYRKIKARKNCVFGHFSRSALLTRFFHSCCRFTSTFKPCCSSLELGILYLNCC